MKKALLPAALILASGVTFAAAPTFEEIDTDQNGSLSQEEAAVVTGLDFEMADKNQDGVLSKEEYKAAVGSEQPAG